MKKQLVKASTMVTLGLLAANLGASTVSAAEAVTAAQDPQSAEVAETTVPEDAPALGEDAVLDQAVAPTETPAADAQTDVAQEPVVEEEPAVEEQAVAETPAVEETPEVQAEADTTQDNTETADQEIKAAATIDNGYQFGSTSYDNGDGTDTVAFAVTNMNTRAPLSGNVSINVPDGSLDGQVATIVTYNVDGLAEDAYEVTIENGTASAYVYLNPATVLADDGLNVQFGGDYAEISVVAPHQESEYTITSSFAADGGQGTKSDSYTVAAGNVVDPGETVDQGNVVMRYVDENGNDIADPETQAVNVGEDFSVDAKSIDGYTLTSDKTVTGTMETMDEVYVTFEYKQDGNRPVEKSKLTVRYVDINDKDIVAPETQEVEKGSVAFIDAKDIPGYYLVSNRTQEVDVNFNEATISFVYTDQEPSEDNKGTLTVKYVDQDGNEIAPSRTSDVFVGFEWEASAKQIDGYTLVGDDYLTGTMNSEAGETIEFKYQNNNAPKELTNVTIQYVDQNWDSIATSVLDQGYFGTTYTAEAKTIDGYTLDGDATQRVVLDDTNGVTITFIYIKDPQVDPEEPEATEGELTINYLDESGKKVAASDSRMVKIGDEYTAEAKEIEGFTIVGTTSVTATMVAANGAYVNFTYKATEAPVDPEVKQGQLTVNYLDKDGNKLANTETEMVDVHKGYIKDAKEIKGYTLISDKTVSGIMNDELGTTINFVYIKDEEAVDPEEPTPATAELRVNYVDAQGNKLAETTTQKVVVGEVYTVSAKAIDGYSILGSDVVTSVMTNADGEAVTFVYTKDEVPAEPTDPEVKEGTLTVNYVDKDGNKVAEQTTTPVQVGKTYSVAAQTLDGYTLVSEARVTGTMTSVDGVVVTFVYAKTDDNVDPEEPKHPVGTEATLTINYADKSGKIIVASETQTVKVGDTYTIKAKSIKGFKLVSAPTITGVVTSDDVDYGLYANFTYVADASDDSDSDNGSDNGSNNESGSDNGSSDNGSTTPGSNNNAGTDTDSDNNANTETDSDNDGVTANNSDPVTNTSADSDKEDSAAKSDDTASKSDEESLPQTGESAKTAGLLSLLGASIVGVVGLIARKRF